MRKPRLLTAPEVVHIKAALEVLREIVEGYPEAVTQRQENCLLVAEEIMNNENPSS